MNRFNQKLVEKYAMQKIAENYNSKYLEMKWNEKGDDFDFTDEIGEHALEVTSVMSDEITEEYKYEESLVKKGYADILKVKGVIETDDAGNIKKFWGGSLNDYREACIRCVRTKNRKLFKRFKKGQVYKEVDLCICIYEAPFFDCENDLNFLCDAFEKTCFMRLFIITRDGFWVIEKKALIRKIFDKDN